MSILYGVIDFKNQADLKVSLSSVYEGCKEFEFDEKEEYLSDKCSLVTNNIELILNELFKLANKP